MFSNIGWLEIGLIVVVAVIVVGPERLPDLLRDARAALYAARKAIRNARAELDGTMEGFEEFREPISQAAQWSRMGPRAAIAKALFDGDEEALDDFDPKKQLKNAGVDTSVSPKEAMRRSMREQDPPQDPRTTKKQRAAEKTNPSAQDRGDFSTGGGFSWSDIT